MSLAERLEAYLTRIWSQPVKVADLSRIPGGASRETYRFAAHVGGAATAANDAMGAEAYATGNHVAFRAAPDLHTAAHEAAHVVQQRAGVALKGGVGEAGDPYEQHADAVADAATANAGRLQHDALFTSSFVDSNS